MHTHRKKMLCLLSYEQYEKLDSSYIIVCSTFIFLFMFSSTFVCPTELIAFSERAQEFAGIDCQVLGVSTDSEFSHLAWINTPRKVGDCFVT